MRICPVCGIEIKGRHDKIYCSAACKSSAQYENRLMSEQVYFRVDKQLKANRKILKKFNKSGYTVLRKDVLIKEGFNPKFFTHYWKNKKDQVYLFCYNLDFWRSIRRGRKSTCL